MGSEATSFLWKLVHHLLPTEDRLSNILPNNTSNCKLCPAPIMADLSHCFFNCISTKEIGGKLLITIAHFDSSVTPDNLLRLEFQADGSQEMPLVWITAQTLLYLWTVRCTGKIVDSNQNEYTILREIFVNNLYHYKLDTLIKIRSNKLGLSCAKLRSSCG